MIETFEIEWKVAGFLPVPIAKDCIYYQEREDHNYAKRTFGRSDLKLSTSTLEPTNLFHQALNAELRRKYDFNLSVDRLPYILPIGKLGLQKINFRFRVFGGQILVLSIHIPQVVNQFSVSEIIKLQMLSSHKLLESIARFCFNVHYCPDPSQVVVRSWLSKPLIKITDNRHQFNLSSLVEIVTRHQGIDKRATAEMLGKNSNLNFNDDILLIDKQGIAFLQRTSDNDHQRNRYKRISPLCEFAVYVKSLETTLAEQSEFHEQEYKFNIENINKILNVEVLQQSVSAHRGWELLKKEMGLNAIDLHGQIHDQESNPPQKKGALPFYLNPIFIAVSALAALLASIVPVYEVIKSIWP